MRAAAIMNALVTRPVRIEPATLLALQAAYPDRYCALLESAASGAPLGRFDILFAVPQETLLLRSDGSLHGPAAASGAKSFLESLDCWWQTLRQPVTAGELPFRGGWLVYLGYELAAQIEPRLQLCGGQNSCRDHPRARLGTGLDRCGGAVRCIAR
jgi:anthranilate/para-aminobenzoate synthase component I